MNRRISLLILLWICAVLPARAELLPPAPSLLTASSTARYILRYDYNFTLFELSADEKSYRLVREFPRSDDRFAIKALVSEDGSFVVAFGHLYEKAKPGGRDEIVSTYSSKGELLRTWRLDEILSKEDLALAVSHCAAGSLWLYHEVGIFDAKKTIVFVGPTDSGQVIEKRYVYFLDLKSGTWERGREEVLKKMSQPTPEGNRARKN